MQEDGYCSRRFMAVLHRLRRGQVSQKFHAVERAFAGMHAVPAVAHGRSNHGCAAAAEDSMRKMAPPASMSQSTLTVVKSRPKRTLMQMSSHIASILSRVKATSMQDVGIQE